MKKKITQILLTVVLSMIVTLSYGSMLRSSSDSCNANFRYYSYNNGTVQFVDSSYVADSARYVWSFGDGDSAFVKNPIHTYASGFSNDYVCLVIATPNNRYCYSCQNVKVRAQDSCKANFTYHYIPDSLNTGFKYTFADSSSSNTTSWNWSFGDGTTSTLKNPVHTYNNLGGSYEHVRSE